MATDDLIPVRVYHRRWPTGLTRALYEHWLDDAVVQVFAIEVPSDRDPYEVCEDLFELLNIGHLADVGADPHAIAYRERGNRSLSVGDLIQVGDAWYTCEPSGFAAANAPRVSREPAPGSVPCTRISTAPDAA